MELNSVKKMQKKLLKESIKNTINDVRYDFHKLKENLIDNIYFAIDKDLVKYLHTLLTSENFHEKVGKIRYDLNVIMRTTTVGMIEKKIEVFEEIGNLGTILDEIKLQLSCGDIRKKYNLSTLLIVEDEDMSDDLKINRMTMLIKHGLDLDPVE